MGLDNFWISPETNEPVSLPELDDLNLTQGLLGDGGSSAFRGKVYNSTVELITGESLYQETIPNATVVKMAEKLSAAVETHRVYADVDKLAQMFTAHAAAGHDLVGWW